MLPRCYDLYHLPPAFSTFILSHSYTLPALLSSTINIDALEYFLSLLLLHMLDHELCAFACNFFAAVVFCLPLDCLFLVRLQDGMPVACALSDYLLFSHLRAVQQTSLLLAFRKGTIFDARWSAYRIVPYTGLCYKYAYVCCQCNSLVC